MSAGKDRTGYLSSGWEAPITNRQDMTDYYSGIASTSGAKALRPYDAEYRQRNNDLKSSTVAGRTPNGSTSMFQNEINMRTNATAESDLSIRRSKMANMPILTPDAAMMGRMTGAQTLYGNMNMDRMDPHVLNALQENPYHIRSANGF